MPSSPLESRQQKGLEQALHLGQDPSLIRQLPPPRASLDLEVREMASGDVGPELRLPSSIPTTQGEEEQDVGKQGRGGGEVAGGA